MDEKKILEELYALEPDLKKHEVVLLKLVQELLASRPGIAIDEEFRKNLRMQLMQRINLMQEEKQTKPVFNLFSMTKISYAIGGVTLVALIALIYFNPTANDLKVAQDSPQNLALLEDGAFGSLRESLNASAGSGGGSAAMGSGGDAINSAPTAEKQIAPGEPYPGPEWQYKFIYKGEDLKIEDDKMAVLARIKNQNKSLPESIIRSLSFGLLNLSSFYANSKIDNITFSEDKDYGYTVSINPNEGLIYINENWMKWPQPNCQDSACYERMRISPSEIQADEKYISVANTFLKERGVNLSNYSDPVINNEWRSYYEAAVDKSQVYIPESVNVVYPLLVDGKFVYEEYGSKYGLNVNIKVRENRVSGVSEITTQNYNSSNYATEKNVSRILEIAAKGGFRTWSPEDTQRNTEVVLGTPIIALVKVWQFKDNSQKELLVPAYIFPVTQAPSGYTYKKNIIVPLIKDVLDSENVGGGPIHTMDLVK